MSNSATVKIECPACGQHYSLEMGDDKTVVTCEKCGKEFTASGAGKTQPSETEPEESAAPEPVPTSPLVSLGRSLGKGTALIDGFLAFMFRFGKTFAGLLAVVFLLGMLVSGGVFLLHLRSGMEVPAYEQLVAAAAHPQGTGAAGSAAQLDERRDIEKRFGDHIAAVVKKFSLGEPAYDGMLRAMKEIKKPYRADYLAGLEDALKAAERAKAKNETNALGGIEVAEAYTEAFRQSEQQAVIAAEEAKATRWTAVGSALACCILLFMMLVIPALLKIEENTRKAATAAETAALQNSRDGQC